MNKLCRAGSFLLCLMITLAVFPSYYLVKAENKEDSKVVRVGWYESPFNLTDAYGRRSGYAYEYQMKISAYTGWTYEYVSGNWTELYQMLLDGQIDLLSDISFTPERQESLLFSSLPMGSEVYYACVSSQQPSDITAEDLSTFNGKRIGVNQDTLQEGLLRDWLEKNAIEAEIVELTAPQSEIIEILNRGDIDVFVDVDVYGIVQELSPVCMIGSSDIFFAVNPSRPDLMNELNAAMIRLQEENRNYNQQLQEKYFNANIVNLYFTQNEVDWIASHGAVRVGYQDNYLAFCAKDETTGELTGALKEYLNLASECMQNAVLVFEAVPFDTIEEAITALQNGEIDCIFPVDLTSYDGEELGLLTTEPIMQTEVYAAVTSDKRHHFSPDEDVTAALIEADRNGRTFVMEYFPTWNVSLYENREDCLDAMAAGEADCTLVCNYQLGKLDDLLHDNGLTPITTGHAMNFAFAVRSHDDDLYGIINKIAHYVPDSAINSALVSYSYDEKVVTLADYLKENIVMVLGGLGTVLTLIMLLLIKSLRSEKKAKASLRALKESLGREEKQQQELDATKDKAYTDPLTGVKSKNAYVEASGAIQRKIDDGEKPEFAIVVFDVNDLKRVNDFYGHEAGDRHILSAKKLICDAFKHSPVYRIG